jgi:hypothetical protein
MIISSVAGDDVMRDVSGLTCCEKQAAYLFLQGAVYCWCNIRKNDWFSLRELMGGNNRDEWSNTPLCVLYTKYIQSGKSPEDAFEAAGKDGGWILKAVVNDDPRKFETRTREVVGREYHWVST